MLSLLWMLACATPEVAETAGPLPAESAYQLDVSLESDSGARVGFDVDRGHPTLVAFFYASCGSVCPMTIASLQQLEEGLPSDERADLRLLLVSLDPARDDLAALKDVRERYGLDDHWTLARAPEDDVRALTAALGVKYKAMATGEISHSAQVALLDADGVVEAKVDLGSGTIEPLRQALAR